MGRAVLIANPPRRGAPFSPSACLVKGMRAAVAVSDVFGPIFSALLSLFPRYNRRGEQFGEQAVILDGLFPGEIGLAESPVVVSKRQT